MKLIIKDLKFNPEADEIQLGELSIDVSDKIYIQLIQLYKDLLIGDSNDRLTEIEEALTNVMNPKRKSRNKATQSKNK